MKNRFSKIPKLSHILLNVWTWEKDSHGLYDYQALPEHYKKESYYLQNQCKLYRNNQNDKTIIKISNQIKTRSDSNAQIGRLKINRENPATLFQLQPYKQERDQQKEMYEQKHKNQQREKYQDSQSKDQIIIPYVVVDKDFSIDSFQGYPLQTGNIIKLGRVQYLVIEVKNNEEVKTLRDTKHFQDTAGTYIPQTNQNHQINGKQEQQLNCKICFCGNQLPDNPLISPCHCKGSCQMIHVGCLRTWINTKVRKQLYSDLATSYNFTKFQCEICKHPFPKYVKIAEKQIEMMTITKPQKPYIIIQSLRTKHQMREEKYLHLISATQMASVKIGRGHTCQIRVTDISVSRTHAEIAYQNNKFYLRDLNSKFGTLVRFNEEIQIKNDLALKLQFGRTLFEFQIQREPLEVDTE